MSRINPTIKRLELEFWQRMVWEGWGDGEPVPLTAIAIGLVKLPEAPLCKTGWYYRRPVYFTDDEGNYTEAFPARSWFEHNGEAYTTPTLPATFEYELKMQNHIPLSNEVRNSLGILIRERLANRELKELMETDIQWWRLSCLKRGVEFYFNHRTKAINFKRAGTCYSEYNVAGETKP